MVAGNLAGSASTELTRRKDVFVAWDRDKKTTTCCCWWWCRSSAPPWLVSWNSANPNLPRPQDRPFLPMTSPCALSCRSRPTRRPASASETAPHPLLARPIANQIRGSALSNRRCRVTTGHNGEDGRRAFCRFLPATSTHRYALTSNLFPALAQESDGQILSHYNCDQYRTGIGHSRIGHLLLIQEWGGHGSDPKCSGFDSASFSSNESRRTKVIGGKS